LIFYSVLLFFSDSVTFSLLIFFITFSIWFHDFGHDVLSLNWHGKLDVYSRRNPRNLRLEFDVFIITKYKNSEISLLGKNGKNPHFTPKITLIEKSTFEISFFYKNNIFIASIFTNSHFQNIIFHQKQKSHFQTIVFHKFTFSATDFSQNSQFQKLIFHKNHICKCHLSQKSRFFKYQIKGIFGVKKWIQSSKKLEF